MKQYILLLVLMVMGAGMTVHAEDVNRLSCNSWGINIC